MTVLFLLGMLAAPAPEPSVTVDLKRPPRQRVAVTRIEGAEPLAWSGFRLASGDVNGDGIDDLVIAAPGGSEDRPSRRGRIYVVHGGMAARQRIDLAIRREPHVIPGKPPVWATAADIVIDARDDFDHLGRSLAVADLDRDGYADIVAGAPDGDGPLNARADCGEVTVVHGGASLPTFIRLDRPAPGVRVTTIHGRKIGDSLGGAIAVGDVSGDGVEDLVLGAAQADGESGAFDALDVGAVFILPGRQGGLDPVVDLAGPAPTGGLFVIEGDDPGDQTGAALAAGDFDGDGLSDIAVGSRGADGVDHRRPDSGEVHLVFGSAVLRPRIALGRDADVVFVSAGVGDLAGSSLAFGDFDGDGAADLAIGAPLADGPRGSLIDAGGVTLILGRPRAMLEALRPPPPEDLSNMARALQELDRVGGIKGGSPAAPAQDPAARPPIAVDLAAGDLERVITLHGLDPGDHAGVRGLADLDRDGMDDLIVGAEDSAGLRNRRAGGGEIHVVFGTRTPPPAWHLDAPAGTASIYGPVGGVRVGSSAEAVDLDGDSRPELVVGAPQAGRFLEGAIWILTATDGELLRPVSK